MSRRRWLAVLGVAAGAMIGAPAGAAAQATDPPITILYQNFPNPFPTSASAITCVWFDIREPGAVTLDVYDLRGNAVRRIFPARGESAALGAGRYGRAPGGSGTGCDPRFAWDGTASNGRVVPAGAYLLRLRAPGGDSVRKMLFRGS